MNGTVVDGRAVAMEAAPPPPACVHAADEEGSEEPNVYFVCGHWEDLTNSELLRPDRNDPRFGEINQDWGKWN